MVRRRLISMLSALSLVLTLFTLLPEGALKAHALTGSGTQSDPYIVTSYAELHDLISWGGTTMANWYNTPGREVYVKLGADCISEDNLNDYDFNTTDGIIHIDLAGHDLIRKSSRTLDTMMFRNSADLYFDDSVGGGKVECDLSTEYNNREAGLIYNLGKLYISGGSFKDYKSRDDFSYNPVFSVGTIVNKYKCEIHGGNFLGTNSIISSTYKGGYTKIYNGYIENLNCGESCTIYNMTSKTSGFIETFIWCHLLHENIYKYATVELDGEILSYEKYKNKGSLSGKELRITTPIATHATIYTPDLVHGGKAEAAQVSGGLGFIMHENCITGWRDLTEGKDMQLGDTFTGGHKYRLGVTIGTQDGYVIGKTPDIFTYIDNAKIISVEKLNDFFCNVILQIDCPIMTVSTVNVTLTEPAAGVAINETMQSTTAGIDVARSTGAASRNLGRWYHGETMMTEGEKFAAGETYTAQFCIRPLTGYELASNPTVKVNGDTATYVKTEGIYRTYEISYTVPSAITTVSTVRITVTKPEAGEIPEDATIFVLTGKVPATVRTAWYHGDTQMASGEKFIAGETYTVKLLITRKASYEFSSPLKVFINNERVTSTNNSYSAVAEKSFTAESGQRLVGDANGDGLISADDAIIVARYAANYGNYQATYNANVCDMNRDGHVTADDAIIIARYAANYGNYRDIYTNYV